MEDCTKGKEFNLSTCRYVKECKDGYKRNARFRCVRDYTKPKPERTAIGRTIANKVFGLVNTPRQEQVRRTKTKHIHRNTTGLVNTPRQVRRTKTKHIHRNTTGLVNTPRQEQERRLKTRIKHFHRNTNGLVNTPRQVRRTKTKHIKRGGASKNESNEEFNTTHLSNEEEFDNTYTPVKSKSKKITRKTGNMYVKTGDPGKKIIDWKRQLILEGGDLNILYNYRLTPNVYPYPVNDQLNNDVKKYWDSLNKKTKIIFTNLLSSDYDIIEEDMRIPWFAFLNHLNVYRYDPFKLGIIGIKPLRTPVSTKLTLPLVETCNVLKPGDNNYVKPTEINPEKLKELGINPLLNVHTNIYNDSNRHNFVKGKSQIMNGVSYTIHKIPNIEFRVGNVSILEKYKNTPYIDAMMTTKGLIKDISKYWNSLENLTQTKYDPPDIYKNLKNPEESYAFLTHLHLYRYNPYMLGIEGMNPVDTKIMNDFPILEQAIIPMPGEPNYGIRPAYFNKILPGMYNESNNSVNSNEHAGYSGFELLHNQQNENDNENNVENEILDNENNENENNVENEILDNENNENENNVENENESLENDANSVPKSNAPSGSYKNNLNNYGTLRSNSDMHESSHSYENNLNKYGTLRSNSDLQESNHSYESERNEHNGLNLQSNNSNISINNLSIAQDELNKLRMVMENKQSYHDTQKNKKREKQLVKFIKKEEKRMINNMNMNSVAYQVNPKYEHDQDKPEEPMYSRSNSNISNKNE